MKSVKCLVALAISASLVVVTPAAARTQQDTYPDVSAGVHKPAIDILAEMGLFDGTLCGGHGFCPSEPIKRSTMAVWLVRSLQDGEPGPTGATRFADVDLEQWWAPYVERLADLEIAVGCQQDPLHFCPDQPIHRDQTAALLVQALDLEPAAPAGFVDIEGNPHAPDIDALAAAGVTAGCKREPLRYCPTDPVTRAQMATFLARALGLVEAPRPIPSPATYKDVAAGGSHSCAIQSDGAATCWGHNYYGQSDAPDGTFEAVAAGNHHTCALRTERTITCWGLDNHGQSDPPDGTFKAVAASSDYSCGLQRDDTVTCWGQRYERGGRFKAVVARFYNGCQLRTDDTLQCWGDSSNAPEGTFKAVAVSDDHACGIRADSTVQCWSSHSRSRAPDPPEGTFRAIAAGEYHTCALRTNGTIECWGSDSNAPEGTFKAIAAGNYHTCALRTDGTIECWDNHSNWGNGAGQLDVPHGGFKAVTETRNQPTCGLRTDDTITCWGSNYISWVWWWDPPAGTFEAVTAGYLYACGLRTDHTVTCWGGGERGPVEQVRPGDRDGTFKAVAAGPSHACGLRTDDTTECWGSNGNGQSDPPEGTFKAVSAGTNHTWRGTHRRHHRMLGQQRERAVGPARRHLFQGGLRRYEPHLRGTHRRHHRMLGRQPTRSSRPARRHLQGGFRRRVSHVRDPQRRHHRVLGPGQLRQFRPARGQIHRHSRGPMRGAERSRDPLLGL